jgi:cell division protease FtsH
MKRKKNNFFKGPYLRNFFMVLLGLFGLLFVLHYLISVSKEIELFNYSTFLGQVEQGNVQKVFVDGQAVRGLLKDGRVFDAVLPAQDSSDWSVLRNNNVELSFVAPSISMLWYLIAAAIFLLAFMGLSYFLRQRGNAGNGGAGGIFTMGKSRAKMFLPSAIKEKFTSVAGADEAKEDLKDVVDFLKDPEKYKRLGAKITRGVLLVGAPGNGKTLLARAVAGEASCPFFSISGSDFVEVFVGVGASRVRDLFAQARKHAPCIVFIDEIDAVGRKRGSGMGGGHDEREQTLNQLLTEMDGFETEGGQVIVLAATNRPDVLDNALLRPGRFDRRVEVPYPDLVSREKILAVHAKHVKMSPEVNLEKIARGTPGFSGAELANLINEAAIIASKENKKSIEVSDFEEARDRVMLGKEIKSIRLTQEDRKITSYHESGHALVGLLLPDETDPLHKLTIIPRGKALGVTHSLPEREKYNSTKEEMIGQIMVCLGGRAAEELVFGKLTTGAYSDFMTATRIARSMVCKYGMSPLGPVIYSQEYGDYQYSNKTSELIDKEVSTILEDSLQKTMDLLLGNRDKLELLATTLLEKETLYAHDVYELLGITPRVQHMFS